MPWPLSFLLFYLLHVHSLYFSPQFFLNIYLFSTDVGVCEDVALDALQQVCEGQGGHLVGVDSLL